MNLQDIVNMLAGLSFTVLGWFARVLWQAVKDLEKDLAKLREELPKTYLPKHEFTAVFTDLAKEMRENFTRLFDKLDGKADKP